MEKFKMLFRIAERLEKLKELEFDRLEDLKDMDMTDNERKRHENKIKQQYSVRHLELQLVLKTVFNLNQEEIDNLTSTQFERGEQSLEVRVADYLLKCEGITLAELSDGKF